MDITDVSPTAMVNAVAANKQAQLEQQVQVSVLKTALDAQASGALALLQAMPAVLPLAPSGSLGTHVNLYV
jgi:hypothetical protein